MKNKIFLMAFIVAAILTSCKTDEPEETTPTALFSFAQNELKVTFTNASQDAQSYVWAFGDGQTSKEKNPIHAYAKAGTYKVQLTATNITKSNTYSQNVTISQTDITPTAKFSYNKNGLIVTFSNSSANAQSYKWEFGDGQTSTADNPSHTYSNYGTYNVTLTAINDSKSNATSQSITLTEVAPKASFTYKTAHPLKVVLANNSTNATSYQWDFGDGTTSTEKNPTHRYKTIGVYKVKLTAKSGNKSDIYTTNVEIKAPSTCAITGFSVTKIPTNNKYYQVQLTDDYIMSKTTYFWTTWFLLSSANLPYDKPLNAAKTLNIENTYVVRLYKYTGTGNPSNTQASGKGDWTAIISSSDLKAYPETLTYSNSTAAIKLNFQWK